MLRRDQASEFLENTLGINDVDKQLQANKKEFLNKIIFLIQNKVPFHTLYLRILLLDRPNKRKLPTVEDINEFGLTCFGGNCVVLNVFTCNLLKALGYSAFVCPATVTSFKFVPHLIVIVKDLEKEGDLHLVDCGLGLPAFRAISLTFDEESPVYQDSFLEYKFIRRQDEILRMHGRGALIDPTNKSLVKGLDYCVGNWRRFYYFTVEMINCSSLSDLDPLFSFAYLVPVPARAVCFPGGKTVILKDDTLRLEKDDQTLEVIKLKSKEEVIETFRKYFPMIDENTVQRALANWHQRVSKL